MNNPWEDLDALDELRTITAGCLKAWELMGPAINNDMLVVVRDVERVGENGIRMLDYQMSILGGDDEIPATNSTTTGDDDCLGSC